MGSSRSRTHIREWARSGQFTPHTPSFADGEETEATYRVAGRLAARRGQGKAAFLDLVDRSGRIQLHARADVLGADQLARLLSLDLGDLIGIDGTAFKSRRGELSLRVDGWTLLAKSLRPPPDKFHGLTDVETRYRRRELDLIANEGSRALFITRSRVISEIRRWLDERGFLEVETPVLQPLYGGALARPFTTHHNQLDRDLYLRIATELYLKRLIVGGLERVYELGKDFRNEGVSHKHNPEFTMLEWYEAYADYTDIAARLEELVAHLADAVGYDGEIDFTTPWRRIGLVEAIAEQTGIDVLEHRDDPAALHAAAAGASDRARSDRHLAADGRRAVLKARRAETVTNPTFFLDYPVELSPFAKSHRSRPGLVERFECCCAGMEFANAFTELNDPDDQRARFEEQQRESEAGEEEAQPYDEDFIRALEHGMPPTGGIGIGIDRLVMILAGRESIREVVLWPAMR